MLSFKKFNYWLRKKKMTSQPIHHDFCKLGLAVIEIEARSIQDLTQRLDQNFNRACEYLLACKGRIVVLGIGKSGHVGGKIAATLASTGSPAFFVHPAEANHGDMGMITSQDVVLVLSNSGDTDEIATLLPLIKRLNIPLIALTGNPNSILAQAATVNIDVSIEQEACPLGLAPTSSTTAALVMGDALAVALLTARGFTTEDFARHHPGGKLGRKLLLRVDEIMHTGEKIPLVTEQTLLSSALIEITAKKLGMTCIVDHAGHLSGIFTDGDLRRALDQNIDIHTTPIMNIMTKRCKTITSELLAVEALHIMETYKITALVVINNRNMPEGVIHLHDLLQAGVV